jgi:hypothetical protein
MGTFGRLEAQITVPTGGWTATVGAGTATIAAGTYYLSSTGSTASDFLATVATAFATASGTTCTVTGSLGEFGTGVVTITFGVAKLITWISTDLRDLLGFTADEGSATSHVGQKAMKSVWLPSCPFANLNGGGTWRGYPEGDFRSVGNFAGYVYARHGQHRVRLDDLRWPANRRERTWIASETTGNQSLEQFWLDGVYGEAGWGTPSGPIRWYPDASDDTTFGTYAVTDASIFRPNQMQENWTGMWAIKLPPLIQVPGTETAGLGSGVGRATIGVSTLTSSSSTTDGTSFATASVSPGANRLELLAVEATHSTLGEVPTSVTGCGLTWVNVGSVGTGTRKLSLWRALGGSPSSGAITVTFATSHLSWCWALIELSGVDTSGTNGSGAIVQTVTTSGSAVLTLTNTLALFEDVHNVHLYAVATAANQTATPGIGFTEQADVGTTATNASLEVATAANALVADPSWGTSAAAWMISVEVKAGTL